MILRLGGHKQVYVALTGLLGFIGYSAVSPSTEIVAPSLNESAPALRIRGVEYTPTLAVNQSISEQDISSDAIRVTVGQQKEDVLSNKSDTLPSAAAEQLEIITTKPSDLISTAVDGGIEADPFAEADDTKQFTTQARSGPTYSVDPELAKKFRGIEILGEMNIPVPTLAFQLDVSEEAVAMRVEKNVKKFIEDEKLPEEVAKLKAQLLERGLKAKAIRASHNQKRTIVRLMQEARLKKDAAEREQRMVLLQMKQEQSKKEMEQAASELAAQKAEQERERQERNARNEAARKEVEERKDMMRKLREDEVKRLTRENDERRQEEKEEKIRDAEEREKRLAAEKESKRKMIEDFQSQVQAQMEEQKKLAREDRIREAQAARSARLQMEADLAPAGGKDKLDLSDA